MAAYIPLVVLAWAGCDRPPPDTIPGQLVGMDGGSQWRVAVVGNWVAGRVASTLPVDSHGGFSVPARATTVIAFEDVDRDHVYTAWSDRVFFCSRRESWRCDVAPARLLIRNLGDEDPETPPIEVYWMAATHGGIEVCQGEACQQLDLVPRGNSAYTQLCDSMRGATLHVRSVDDRPVTPMVSLPLGIAPPLKALEARRSPDEISVTLSQPPSRARMWMQHGDGAEPVELAVSLAADTVTATLAPDTCQTPSCTVWLHAAHLANQRRVGDVLVDEVNELHMVVP